MKKLSHKKVLEMRLCYFSEKHKNRKLKIYFAKFKAVLKSAILQKKYFINLLYLTFFNWKLHCKLNVIKKTDE